MKFFFAFIVLITAMVFLDYTLLPAAAIALWAVFFWELFMRSNNRLAFREFLLTLYGVNYLLAPALIYQMPPYLVQYKMKLPENAYFELAIPAMLCLRWGLFAIKTNIFDVRYEVVDLQALINQKILKFWLIGGLTLAFIKPYVPGELGFFVYLLGLIRFIAAFALFALDRRKYRWWLLGTLLLEVSQSVMRGMFHDLVMWLIFFGLFWVFLAKPKFWVKVSFAGIVGFTFFILQISKSDYRKQTWFGDEEAGFGVLTDVALKNATAEGGLFSEKNIANSLTRVNQAWILASTVNNMERRRDFQHMHLMGLYLEAALLPRFLAPNKITSGNKEIFNRYSGYTIRKGTSMGLGIFADGYVAYGYWGTLLFGLGLGLLFGLVFKVVERWAEISPFFVLFIFPILNYAVRPDCETQTTIGHLIKSLMVFGLTMIFYRKYFTRKIYLERRKQSVSDLSAVS